MPLIPFTYPPPSPPHLALSTPLGDEQVSLVDHEHKHDTEGFKRIPEANFSSTEYQLHI